jgi:hypothetical protein
LKDKAFREVAAMKSVLIGCICAVVIAFGAFLVLDNNIQQTADERFATTGVRL